jgi:hypothetical protein
MKNAVIKYGICADNVDPWGVGRIRVIIDTDMVPPLRTGTDIQKLLAKLDADNVTAKGDAAYVPWELGVNYHAPDPYLFEPFLPKNINIIPKIGESVKIIYYSMDNNAEQREYVGMHTSNYDKIYYDSGESARSFTKLSKIYSQKNDLRFDGLVPDVNDIGFLGRKNSDIIFPEDEVVIRAGHQDFPNHLKNRRAALIQTAHFTTRKNVTTETINENVTPITFIDNIVEFFVAVLDPAKFDNNVYAEMYVYSVPNLDTINYAAFKDYYADTGGNAEFVVFIYSKNAENIVSFIQTFLKNIDKNNLNLDLSGTIKNFPENNTTLQYAVVDARTSKNGEPIDNFYSLNLYQFRPSPLNDLSNETVLNIVNSLPSELRPSSKKPTQQFKSTEKETTENDNSLDETAIVEGADKMFLLSWNAPNALQNKIGKYGFLQEDIYTTLQKYTQPMIRGDLLLNLILDLIDLIEKHGHIAGVDPIGSLNYDAVNKISTIKDKYALLAKVNKDLSGGSDILNQYLRIN